MDSEYIIPTNDSLSITIDSTDLCSYTIIKLVEPSSSSDPQETQDGTPIKQISSDEKKISIILNEKEEVVSKRIKNVIEKV